MCRLMEHKIKDQLLGYLLNKNLISKHQHAFIIKHSTASSLLECIHDWSVALNDSNSVDVIYIDFKRAFDSIVYSKLIHKLTCYCISGKLLAWISAFLHNRMQSVVIENTNSVYVDVISGVPQDSVLGPILFIDDIVAVCLPSTELKLFADYLKLYSVIKITNPLTGFSATISTSYLLMGY
jgi:ribonuclease P/MRP protein subunit RPP40